MTLEESDGIREEDEVEMWMFLPELISQMLCIGLRIENAERC
jgi:hypothetical protein